MLVYLGVFKGWLEAALDSGRILEVFCVCVCFFFLVGIVIDVHFRHNYAFPPGRERGSLTPKNSKKPASLVGFTPSHHHDYIFLNIFSSKLRKTTSLSTVAGWGGRSRLLAMIGDFTLHFFNKQPRIFQVALDISINLEPLTTSHGCLTK